MLFIKMKPTGKTIAAWSGVLLLLGNYSLAQPAEGSTLKEAYKEDAFKMGVAVDEAIVSGRDKASQDIVRLHFNSITVENVMKAGPINPQPGVFNFGPADAFVEFGKSNGMFIVGHTLVWHNQTPEWFFKDEKGNTNSPAAQTERLRKHIEAVAGRYAGRVHAWDVVNELIAEDGSRRLTPMPRSA